jgi:hypothetical protein
LKQQLDGKTPTMSLLLCITTDIHDFKTNINAIALPIRPLSSPPTHPSPSETTPTENQTRAFIPPPDRRRTPTPTILNAAFHSPSAQPDSAKRPLDLKKAPLFFFFGGFVSPELVTLVYPILAPFRKEHLHRYMHSL